jgi:hypothetical protein
MKFKSALLTQASGSVGGSTFTRNRGGMIIRARAIPVNPNSTFQQTVRSTFGNLASRWSDTLTPAQRTAWEQYANAVPYVDALGDSRYLTGQQMYIRCNSVRIQAALTVVDAGPTVYTMDSFTAPTVTAVVSTQKISVAYTNTDDWANEVGGGLMVLSSAPRSAARNYFKGPYRYAGKVAGAGTPPTSPLLATSPFVFVAGDRVFASVRTCRADGRISPPFRATCIAA